MATTLKGNFEVEQVEGNSRRTILRGSSGYGFTSAQSGKITLTAGDPDRTFTVSGHLYLYSDDYVKIQLEFFDENDLSTGRTVMDNFRGFITLPGKMAVSLERTDQTTLPEAVISVVMALA